MCLFKLKIVFFVKVVYLRSLFDDEGCVALRIFDKTKEWKRSITLSSNSFRLLKEVKFILEKDFLIFLNKIIRNKKSIKDRCFVLAITGRENFDKYANLIGFKLLEFEMKKIRWTASKASREITVQPMTEPFLTNS